MGIRPGRLVVGIAGVTAALATLPVTATQATSSPATPSVVKGAVTATGQQERPDAVWQVEHRAPGTYVVTVPGERVALDVTLWQEIADVHVAPLGDGATRVRFVAAEGPVDTGFSFTTVARR